jgi:hypothetical protein
MGVLEVLAVRALETTRNLPAKEAIESHHQSEPKIFTCAEAATLRGFAPSISTISRSAIGWASLRMPVFPLRFDILESTNLQQSTDFERQGTCQQLA